MPKMSHPNSKHVIEVAADQVRLYASQGWVVKSNPKKKTSARTTTQAPAAENKE